MSPKINTLKKHLGTLLIAVGLLVGTGVSTQAQRRHGPPPWARANGRRYDRPYGEVISARRHARNELRREMWRDRRDERRQRRLERRDINRRWRNNR